MIWKERPNSRESSENPRSIVLRYSLSGETDDRIVRAYAEDATPYIYDDLYKQDIQVDPQGYALWHVDVPYGPRATKPATADQLEYRWNVDTTGGTAKITHARAHIKSYAKNGETPPDHQGTIGITLDGQVEGCEIVIPAFKWQEYHQFPAKAAPWAYTGILEALTGTVCAATFRGRAPGTVRFDGATGGGSSKDPAIVEYTYNFVSSPDVKGITIGSITGIAKPGWAYLWTEYEKVEDNAAQTLATRPRYVHVERVYEPANWNLLRIGS
jgi:hypothetical protein